MTENAEKPQDIAVLIPCYNEEAAIATVVNDFRAQLPGARICVFDNNSSDRTAEVAREAGAEVWFEPRQGKGNVVRRMFSEIEADVYLMVDGDATYDAASAGAQSVIPSSAGKVPRPKASMVRPPCSASPAVNDQISTK